ncbi:MAG: hypothetical protein ACJ8D5_09610 [Sphingomicrobium sp.]
MNKSVVCVLLLGLSTAAFAGNRYGNYVTGTPNAAQNSGSFTVCKMPLLNRGGYVETPCDDTV